MSRLLASFLFCVLVLLPMAPAFASEVDTLETASIQEDAGGVESESVTEAEISSDTTESAKVEEIVSDEDTAAIDDLLPDSELATEETNIESLEYIEESEASTTLEDISQDEETEAPVLQDVELSSSSSSTNPESEGISQSEETATTTSDDQSATTTGEIIPESIPPVIEDVQPPAASSTEDIIDIETAPISEVATVTPEVVQIDTTAISLAIDEASKFTFSKDECVSVGDGSFYCSSGTTTPSVFGTDRVFSAVDQDGDKEIFVERDGELIQISFNMLDDDAPYFDEVSNTIVWHRLIDERYQIISYDVETGEEAQLTSDRYNNMEPSRYGDITVWQGWVGSDWEVMLEEKGELSMITDNTTSDVSPRINGNYIIWQAFDNNAWRVKVYDRITKQVSIIEDADGASVDNPRFVLVYDTKHENGDVETKGYDLESGEVMPLNSSPTSVPQEIPDPEQTGEERALVQPPVQVKTKIATSTNPEPDPTDDTYATSTETGTLVDVVIPPPTHFATSTDDVILETEFDTDGATSSISDVVIPSVESLFEEDVAHIEDLIITPYVEPITDTLDSQETVASST